MFSDFRIAVVFQMIPGLSSAAKFPIRFCKKDVQSSAEGTRGGGVTSVRRRTEALERGHVNFHWRVLLPCNKSNRCSALHPRMAWSICQVGKVSEFLRRWTATPCGARLNHRDTWNGCLSEENLRRTLGNRRPNARALRDAASAMKIRESLPPDLSSLLASAMPFSIIGWDHRSPTSPKGSA